MSFGALRVLFLLLLLAALALFPLLAEPYQLQLSAKIMIFAIFAMSLNLLVGVTGLASLGHAAFFGIGAYALLLLSPEYAAANFWLALVVAIAASALAALAIGLLVLRTSGVYFIMVTLAFAQMLFYFAVGSKALGGSDGATIYVRPAPTLLGWTPFNLANRVHFYYLALAAMAMTYVLLRRLLRSLFGRALVAIRVNPHRMQALGYPVFRYRLAAFVLAGALAGIAGLLDAAQFGSVNPELLGWRQSGHALMMVILGGMGTLYGPILGSLVLTLLQEFLGDLTRHWPLPLGLFIIAAVLVLPQGLGGLFARFGERLDG